jgi:hypothetical protein
MNTTDFEPDTAAFYVEVDGDLVNYCGTWRDAIHKALEWSAQKGRQVVIWGKDGREYPNWKPVVPAR